MKFLIFIVVVVLIVIYFITVSSHCEAVISSETEISVQLDRRGKVFDSLLATVKNI